MTLGGPTISREITTIIRFGGLFLPIVLTLYGLMLQAGALPNDHFVGPGAFYAICSAWIVFGIYQMFVPSRSAFETVWRLVAFHAVASLYLIAVSGFTTPFIAAWIALMLTAFVYYGSMGLYLSAANLILIAIIDISLSYAGEQYMLNVIMSLIATFLVAAITISITKAHSDNNEELAKSRAEELLQRDRTMTLVNNLADAILSVNKRGEIEVFNAAALNLLDTNQSLSGLKLAEVLKLSDGSKKRINVLRELHAAKSVVIRDDLSATVSGETIHLSVIFSPIRSIDSNESDVGKDGYIIILRDITKQKSLEEERDEFISVISHELRTPLTIAEGTLSNTQVMMSRTDMPKTTIEQSVKLAHDQVIFLARMVNDLSTLSRAERGIADTPEVIDVEAMIHDLYTEYAKQAEAKGLKFNLDLDPKLGTVTASRLYLKELLQNFVTNSIKYTKEGDVTVEVKKIGKSIRFIVHDTGIGISKSDQSHIFEKFYRAEDYRTRETTGTGLGLYVSAKLSRKLHTTIEMKSRLNHGSSFSFDLPVSTTE